MFLFLPQWGVQHCHKFHPAAMPFPAHYASVVLLLCESGGVVLQGLSHPSQHLAMLQQHAHGLLLKVIQVFMAEERKEETEIIYFIAFVFVKKSLQIRFDQLVQYCVSPTLHRVLCGQKEQRCQRTS